MGATTYTLSAPVAPGGVTDISIPMVAPDKPSIIRSSWSISTPDGQRFGQGFFVQVIVGIKASMGSMILVYVPAGPFKMGSKALDVLTECQKFYSGCQSDWFVDEEPQHTVILDDFWIDQTEITNAMYAKCVFDGKCNPPQSSNSYTRASYYGNPQFDNYPVIHVSWEDANSYCSWAGRRLPTEAEWERAARGDYAWIYPWGNQFNGTLANFCDKNCSFDWANNSYDDGYTDTSPVGSYPKGASPYGAFDMVGNVWEWVADWYNETYYASLPSSNPVGPAVGSIHVLRGGSWDANASVVRTADRDWDKPALTHYPAYGFRCAMGAAP